LKRRRAPPLRQPVARRGGGEPVPKDACQQLSGVVKLTENVTTRAPPHAC
jgi:hypothetical protein